MKVIVKVSGGKDSTASLLWTIHEFCGGKTDNIIAVFNDTKFEHPLVYEYLAYLEEKLGIKIIRCRSRRFDGFMDLVRQKKRFPSTKARFCTEKLKVEPAVDFILDNINEDIIVVQGVRRQESAARAVLPQNCTYFRYYFEPYGFDKNGNPKLRSYRKKEVKKFVGKYAHELLRPIIDWSTQDVFAYHEKYNIKPNPLYEKGFSRVGCFPCIMATKDEIRAMVENDFMAELEMLEKHEQETGLTFFPPNYIPKRYHTKQVPVRRGGFTNVASVRDVINYVQSKQSKKHRRFKESTMQLFCNELVPCHY